jgi:hypothetical protein
LTGLDQQFLPSLVNFLPVTESIAYLEYF